MVLANKPSLNANTWNTGDNSKTASPTTKTDVIFSEESKIPLISKDIYSKRGFSRGNMSTPDGGSANGEVANGPQATETEEEMTQHQDEENEERRPERKKTKNRDESKSKLGFGPYADWAYGEVLARNPRYAGFTMEEGNAIIPR